VHVSEVMSSHAPLERVSNDGSLEQFSQRGSADAARRG